MVTSENINELAAALAKAQAEMGTASKSGKNPHLKNRYADLADVAAACMPALNANGLAVIQAPTMDEGAVHLHCRIVHTSGQFVETVLSAPLSKRDAQSVGSAVTYLRRYTLAAMAGVVVADDDGNDASAKPERPQRKPEPLPEAPAQQRAHWHPSYSEASEARITAALQADVHELLTAKDLGDYMAHLGNGRPSGWTAEDRAAMMADRATWGPDFVDFCGKRIASRERNAGA